MTDEHIDVELITARDPDTGREVEALVIPVGYIACLMTREEAAKYAEWQEAVAVRIRVDEDDTFGFLEVTADLDWVTSPEADDAA